LAGSARAGTGGVWHGFFHTEDFMGAKTNGKATELGPVTNGGRETIEEGIPYTALVRLRGVADVLFHRWNCEAVAAKAGAAKGSKAKKTDNVESYVYRDDAGHICLPGEYLRGAIVGAAKFRQDPRSPRKSAQDLFKAAVVVLTPLAPVLVGGVPTTEWQYEHQCRVQVQRNGVTRVRPAFKVGWEAELEVLVNLPQYVPQDLLNETIIDAGRLIGLADFRPTYGRFQCVSFKVVE
jgi:hypothetical protein